MTCNADEAAPDHLADIEDWLASHEDCELSVVVLDAPTDSLIVRMRGRLEDLSYDGGDRDILSIALGGQEIRLYEQLVRSVDVEGEDLYVSHAGGSLEFESQEGP